jgi:hypothetical protein
MIFNFQSLYERAERLHQDMCYALKIKNSTNLEDVISAQARLIHEINEFYPVSLSNANMVRTDDDQIYMEIDHEDQSGDVHIKPNGTAVLHINNDTFTAGATIHLTAQSPGRKQNLY